MADPWVKTIDGFFRKGGLKTYSLGQWVNDGGEITGAEQLHQKIKGLIRRVEGSSISNAKEFEEWIRSLNDVEASQLLAVLRYGLTSDSEGARRLREKAP